MRQAPLLSALLLLAGSPALRAAEPPSPLEEVASLLAGTFDSRDQAESDPKTWKAERLLVVRVPKSRLGDPVLYAERAPVATPNKPSRQRFYRLEETADGGVVARVMEPKDRLAVSGKWRDPADLALFGEGDVVERIGCAVRLKKTHEGWFGASEGKNCPSSLPGARYSELDFRLFPDHVELWDRSYDAADEQTFSSERRPYSFVRRSAGPPEDAK